MTDKPCKCAPHVHDIRCWEWAKTGTERELVCRRETDLCEFHAEERKKAGVK